MNTNGNHNTEQYKAFYFTRTGAELVSATVKLSDGLSLIREMREQGWWFVRALCAEEAR